MGYSSLGRTGVKVSPLCLGCMMFGGKTDLDTTCRIIYRTLDDLIRAGKVGHIGTSTYVRRGNSSKRSGWRKNSA